MYMHDVKHQDQGSYPVCQTVSVLKAMEWQAKQNGYGDLVLSVKYSFINTRDGGGGSTNDILEQLKAHGVTLDSLYPFNPNEYSDNWRAEWKQETEGRSGERYKVSSYKVITSKVDSQEKRERLDKELALRPVIVTVNADDDWFRGGLPSGKKWTRLHAVVIIGKLPNGNYLVMNSWRASGNRQEVVELHKDYPFAFPTVIEGVIAPEPINEERNMKLLSQLDPQWSSVKLGASNLTMGRWGCTTVCLSMISSYFDDYISPPALASDAHNYTHDGLVIWNNVSSKFSKMEFVGRVRGTTQSLMPRILDSLKNPNEAVLLQVDNGAHWVVAYSTKFLTGRLTVADPLGGKIVDVLATYGNITGAAYFQRRFGAPVIPTPPPVPVKPKKRLIKAENSPHIYFYNGVKKFRIPDWYTFVELFSTMDGVEILPPEVVDPIKEGQQFVSVEP